MWAIGITMHWNVQQSYKCQSTSTHRLCRVPRAITRVHALCMYINPNISISPTHICFHFIYTNIIIILYSSTTLQQSTEPNFQVHFCFLSFISDLRWYPCVCAPNWPENYILCVKQATPLPTNKPSKQMDTCLCRRKTNRCIKFTENWFLCASSAAISFRKTIVNKNQRKLLQLSQTKIYASRVENNA